MDVRWYAETTHSLMIERAGVEGSATGCTAMSPTPAAPVRCGDPKRRGYPRADLAPREGSRNPVCQIVEIDKAESAFERR